MEIKINIADLGPVGLAHLFLALRDGVEQVQDSNGPDCKEGQAYDEASREVLLQGASHTGLSEFLDQIRAIEKAQ